MVAFVSQKDSEKTNFAFPSQTGSIYEYTARNSIFGVVPADSPFYAPILGVFVFTGFPLSAWLFVKCVAAANADSERADKLDGM